MRQPFRLIVIFVELECVNQVTPYGENNELALRVADALPVAQGVRDRSDLFVDLSENVHAIVAAIEELVELLIVL